MTDTNTKVLWIKIDTRSRRRWAVLAMYTGYIAGCAFAAGTRNSSGIAFQLNICLMSIAFLIPGVCWLALAKLLREYGLPGDSRLFVSRDERQTMMRHQAFVRAYRILEAVICIGLVYVMLASDSGFWLPGPRYVKFVLFGLILVATSLPSAVIAWSEPDAVPDAIAGGTSTLRV